MISKRLQRAGLQIMAKDDITLREKALPVDVLRRSITELYEKFFAQIGYPAEAVDQIGDMIHGLSGKELKKEWQFIEKGNVNRILKVMDEYDFEADPEAAEDLQQLWMDVAKGIMKYKGMGQNREIPEDVWDFVSERVENFFKKLEKKLPSEIKKLTARRNLVAAGFEVMARNVANIDKIKEWLEQFPSRHNEKTHKWIKKQVRNWLVNEARARKITKAPEHAPDWLKNAIEKKEAVYEVALTQRLAEQINHMLDYLDDNIDSFSDINRLSVKDAFQHTKDADEAREKASDKYVGEDVVGVDIDVVTPLSDGFKVVQLKSEEALKREGEAMGHCVGGHGYFRRIQEGTLFILSLRDPTGNPSCTLEVSANGMIDQMKGKFNRGVKEEHRQYMIEFLKLQGDEEEMDELLNPPEDD